MLHTFNQPPLGFCIIKLLSMTLILTDNNGVITLILQISDSHYKNRHIIGSYKLAHKYITTIIHPPSNFGKLHKTF